METKRRVATGLRVHASRDQAISENVGSQKIFFYEWSDKVIDDWPLVTEQNQKQQSRFEVGSMNGESCRSKRW
jgi:hypothetical protein